MLAQVLIIFKTIQLQKINVFKFAMLLDILEILQLENVLTIVME